MYVCSRLYCKKRAACALDKGVDELRSENGEAVRVRVREAVLAELLVHPAFVAFGDLALAEYTILRAPAAAPATATEPMTSSNSLSTQHVSVNPTTKSTTIRRALAMPIRRMSKSMSS